MTFASMFYILHGFANLRSNLYCTNCTIHVSTIPPYSCVTCCRYVAGDGDTHEEPEYGDSESESEDDDLDSVSVIADRTRDRLSGTGSTHSHDGSTHSHDSGIGDPTSDHLQDKVEKVGGGAAAPRVRVTSTRRRPDSAVPSEYSLASSDTASSCGEYGSVGAEAGLELEARAAEDKVHCRPLQVAAPDQAAEVRTEAEARLAKAHTVAAELLKTEAHYVAILHLIDQVSRAGSWQRGNNVFCVADQ